VSRASASVASVKNLLALAAIGEGVVGLVLLVYPETMTRLLLGTDAVRSGPVMIRIAAIALIALGLACWPSSLARPALTAMLTYSALVTIYLAYIGIGGEVGILLWPIVALHALLSVLLAAAWWENQPLRRRAQGGN
jgi:hypothetical protein